MFGHNWGLCSGCAVVGRAVLRCSLQGPPLPCLEGCDPGMPLDFWKCAQAARMQPFEEGWWGLEPQEPGLQGRLHIHIVHGRWNCWLLAGVVLGLGGDGVVGS